MTTTGDDWDDIENMLNTCIAHRGALTDWEEKFIDDMSDRLEKHRELTIDQLAILNKVHTKCCRRRR